MTDSWKPVMSTLLDDVSRLSLLYYYYHYYSDTIAKTLQRNFVPSDWNRITDVLIWRYKLSRLNDCQSSICIQVSSAVTGWWLLKVHSFCYSKVLSTLCSLLAFFRKNYFSMILKCWRLVWVDAGYTKLEVLSWCERHLAPSVTLKCYCVCCGDAETVLLLTLMFVLVAPLCEWVRLHWNFDTMCGIVSIHGRLLAL